MYPTLCKSGDQAEALKARMANHTQVSVDSSQEESLLLPRWKETS